MRTLILTVVCGAVLASGLLAAPVPKMKEKTTEEKLVGKWKLVKSNGKAVTFDFIIDFKAKGELAFIRTFQGMSNVSDGKYTVLGDDKVDWKVSEGGRERGEIGKIKLLNADKFVMEDPNGIQEEFERVVEKKEEPKKEEPKKEEPKKD
jgi:uncharacterized protein (TIGR03066 family)